MHVGGVEESNGLDLDKADVDEKKSTAGACMDRDQKFIVSRILKGVALAFPSKRKQKVNEGIPQSKLYRRRRHHIGTRVWR